MEMFRAPAPRYRPRQAAILRRMERIAGDVPRHITMQPAGPRKYIELPNKYSPGPAPVTGELLRKHLDGGITLGSYLRLQGGLTWAVCWDADDAQGWEDLVNAGYKLLRSGARPVVEVSPSRGKHAGGGHLWITFWRPVDPRAARATAEKVAPELAGFEFWPQGGAVRLLGGRYRHGGTSAWCEAAALRGPDEWVTGWDAAALAWSEETPSGWVTEPAPVQSAECPPPAALTALSTEPVEGPIRQEPEAWSDPWWVGRYGAARRSLRWAVSTKQAVNWYNWVTDIYSVLPREGNGYARATWRNERTPSVAYRDGKRWIDYGARAKPNQKGGDVFEAYVLKCYGGNRSRALAGVCRGMLALAEREMESAARSGRGVPGWVAEIMSSAGWTRYWVLRAAEGGDKPLGAALELIR